MINVPTMIGGIDQISPRVSAERTILALGLAASAVLAERLDQLGHRYHFRAGLLGIVTALGADSPEIAAAASALLSGNHELGRGVIFGSNIFNIAALFGLSAIIAGRIPVTRANGAMSATQIVRWVRDHLPTGAN